MASPWQRFFRPDYLLDPAPALGRAWPLFALLAALCLLGLIWSWRARPLGRIARWQAAICAVALTLTLGRLWHLPGLTARLWPLLACALAILVPLAYRWTRPPWPTGRQRLARILALQPQPDDRADPLAWLVGLLPLAYPALVAALRLALPSGLEAQVRANLLPDPWILPFDLPAAVVSGAAYSLLCLGALLLAGPAGRAAARQSERRLAALLLGGVLLWAAAVYLAQRTAGVTGSDPYAYAQMAVDLVQRGSLLHRFELFERLASTGVAWYPIVHTGYSLPLDAAGHAATVWPPGWPLLLALPYRLWGEAGLYLAAPLWGLLAIGLCAWFVLRVSDAPNTARRGVWLAAALSALLLATSYEQTDRLLTPMADVGAQVFSLLALGSLLSAWRAAPQRLAQWGLCSGLCFGAAYLIRHTQLLLALPCLLAIGLAPFARWSDRARLTVSSALGALPFGLADLWYHARLSGNIWQPESPESFLFSLAHSGRSAGIVLEEALRRNEWGLLWPLALLGVWTLARRAPRASLVLATTVLALLAVHLPYGALRMRDLLSLFPLLALWTAWGAAALLLAARRWAARSPAGQVVSSGLTFILIFALAARTYPMLARLAQPPHASFGFVTAEQRTAFARIQTLTETNAVIGATLNSGALDLLSDRRSVRPADWSPADWQTVIAALQAQGRPLYLLEDSAELAPVLEQTARHFRLTPVAVLPIPVFGDPAHVSRTLWRIGPP